MAFLDRFQKWSAAIAFAEAGEFETARSISMIPSAAKKARDGIVERVERTWAAVAFAEEGLFEEASDLLRPTRVQERESRPSFLEIVGLQHAPARMYVMTT